MLTAHSLRRIAELYVDRERVLPKTTDVSGSRTFAYARCSPLRRRMPNGIFSNGNQDNRNKVT